MTLEQNLRTNIMNDSGVTAVLGDRLYITRLPQNPVYPCAVYQRISTVRQPTMNQQGNTRWMSSGWARFQFTTFSNDGAGGAAAAIAAADAIRAALPKFNLSSEGGPMTGAPNFVVGERAGDIPDTMPPVYTQMLDVKVFFRDQ